MRHYINLKSMENDCRASVDKTARMQVTGGTLAVVYEGFGVMTYLLHDKPIRRDKAVKLVKEAK